MLFNSREFIFCFLPLVLGGFFFIARRNHRLAALWVACASLFFYGWWNPRFVLLLLASIVCNYSVGFAISRARNDAAVRKRLLFVAVAGNLLLLAYYKYTNFLIGTANALAGSHWSLHDIVLPLGISFFTFTQIAFLVDASRGIAREYNFVHYLLFVTYFPHLIAGPVLHHKQMMPQFADAGTYRPNLGNLNAGLTIFTIGLCKKVLLADHFALYANPIFDAAAHGAQPGFADAWIATLSYTLQLYFDFSGYSDMAIGLSRMFNVNLPLNFDSPYKATNIVDFWRRWHMTLSAFLRDYLYIPLGGNRHGVTRRYVNLLTTMVLGGLWHGASWTFVLWGALHGLYLVVNHGWLKLRERLHLGTVAFSRPLAATVTFLAVVIAWIPFRSTGIHATASMLKGVAGLSPAAPGAPAPVTLLWLLAGLVIVKALPNSMQIAAMLQESRYRGRLLGVAVSCAFVFAVLNFNRVSQFIYFQF